jgi:hypothetical protein
VETARRIEMELLRRTLERNGFRSGRRGGGERRH